MENQEKVFIGEGGKSLLAMADKIASMKKAITVARQVKAKLKELGWTNKQLAQAMGCSQPMVTKIVRGDQNLTLETISKLERVLGFKEIYLHKQEEKPVPNNRVIVEVCLTGIYSPPVFNKIGTPGTFQKKNIPSQTNFANIMDGNCYA